ncbi:hypothetical protein [Frondihabitans sucicola]|nr:hypothetical protein [Frondihabitans sucicola]
MSARLPRQVGASHPASVSPASRPHRPLRATLLSAVIPSAAAIAVVVGFYSWSVHAATIDDDTFELITPEMPTAAAQALLPPRQAPVRLAPSAPHDPAWSCSYYSDGNFPLGLAVFQVCFHDGVVVSTADLRQESWL